MRLSRYGLVVLMFCLFSGLATAGSFSFTGTFIQDDQLEVFLFTAPSASVTLETWGYAGTGAGTNAAGTPILPGGFDPVLTVFDCGIVCGLDSSTYVDSNNDGTGVATDPVTGNAYDSLLVLGGLDPTHMYALVLSENDNTYIGPTFGDGFSQSGRGNFTSVENGCGDGNPFCESPFVSPRTGQWAVDILDVGGATDAAAPEPGSMLLLLTGIGAVALLRRQVKQFKCSR
jgi:hypothetical protein